jgi:hypothetical protein
MSTIHTVPPADLVARYEAGASLKSIADLYDCRPDVARRILIRAGATIRPAGGHETPFRRTPSARGVRCGDCGEPLDRPHVLGAHLPGCHLNLGHTVHIGETE